MLPSGIVSTTVVFVAVITSLITSVTSVISVLLVRRDIKREEDKYQHELKNEISDQLLTLEKNLREARASERGEYRLAMEQRRLGEANVVAESELELISSPNMSPFLIFRMPLANQGDGPVDILASLVSARRLSSEHLEGIGLRGRDVEWDDYEKYFWDEQSSKTSFAGISTTKNMLARPTHYIRLSPSEKGALRRIDGVNDQATFLQSAPHHLMYRAFLVVRGYPLGEIMRQLGGRRPDPVQNADLDKVQFESIAQPNYWRWRQVQEALLNLNRLAFRVATGEDDPLGELTEQDSWRIFLLYHEQFANDAVVDALSEATKEIPNTFKKGLVLPAGFRSTTDYHTLQDKCRQVLNGMCESWNILKDRMSACKNYKRGEGYPKFNRGRQWPSDVLKEGYPAMIHQDPDCTRRWLDLVGEGYLVSQPFGQIDINTIPDDPRILEPYVMRIHYFLKSVQ